MVVFAGIASISVAINISTTVAVSATSLLNIANAVNFLAGTPDDVKEQLHEISRQIENLRESVIHQIEEQTLRETSGSVMGVYKRVTDLAADFDEKQVKNNEPDIMIHIEEDYFNIRSGLKYNVAPDRFHIYLGYAALALANTISRSVFDQLYRQAKTGDSPVEPIFYDPDEYLAPIGEKIEKDANSFLAQNIFPGQIQPKSSEVMGPFGVNVQAGWYNFGQFNDHGHPTPLSLPRVTNADTDDKREAIRAEISRKNRLGQEIQDAVDRDRRLYYESEFAPLRNAFLQFKD